MFELKASALRIQYDQANTLSDDDVQEELYRMIKESVGLSSEKGVRARALLSVLTARLYILRNKANG